MTRGRDGESDNLGSKVAAFTIGGLLLLVGVAWVALYLYAGDEAPRNARVEGISIAGLSPAEAEQRLRDGLAERAKEPVDLTYGDGRGNTIDPAAAGLTIDYQASIEEAGGGSGFGPGRMWEAMTGGSDHHAEITVDQSKMQAVLDKLDEGIETRPVEGSITFSNGRAVPVASKDGVVVERGATQAILERRFLHGGSQKIPTETRKPEISDEAVDRAMTKFAEPAMSAPVTLVLGGQRVAAPPRLFGKGLSMEAEDGELEPRVDGELLLEAIDPVMRTVGREPVDARIVVKGGKPRVVPAKVGVELDPAEIEDKFAEVAVRSGAERRLEVEGKETQPAFTTKDAEKLKVTERVSRFTTNFPYAEYRNVNLTRAANLINGTLLAPGETFSLNDIVGERTAKNGFTEGYVVADGVFKKDLGGGVSQIATTTFNAMFFAGSQGHRAQAALGLHRPLPGGPRGHRGMAVRRPEVHEHHPLRGLHQGLGAQVQPDPGGCRDGGDVLHQALEDHRDEGPAHQLHLPRHALLAGGELRGVQRDDWVQHQRLPVLSRPRTLARCCVRRSSTPTTSRVTT